MDNLPNMNNIIPRGLPSSLESSLGSSMVLYVNRLPLINVELIYHVKDFSILTEL